MAIVDLEATLAGTSALTAAAEADYAVQATLAGTSMVVATASAGLAGQATLAGTSSFTGALSVVTGFAAPVRYQPPARTVASNRMILEPVDLFLGDEITRAQGVGIADLQLRIYLNGSQLSWPLASGVGVPDVRIAAGKIYWHEFSAGFYEIRFYPNAVGLWRILLTYPTHSQAVSLSYDVGAQVAAVGSIGIRTSFFRR